MPTFFHPAKFY